MKNALLVALGCVCSLGVSWPHPLPNFLQLAPAQPINTLAPSLAPRDNQNSFNTYGHWIHARAETTTEATTAATADTSQTPAQSTATEATTAASTTTTAAETSTTSQTTSPTSTCSTSSTTTTGTSTTSTASITTSTATATSTASAALAERNRKGKIAAIITFSLLGSLFFGICIVSRVRKALAKKRKAAAAAAAVPQKRPVSGSTYSMVPLTDDAGRPTSEPRFDRESIMFARSSQPDLRAYGTPRGSAYFDPNAAGGSVRESSGRSEGGLSMSGQQSVMPSKVL
ncbi:hypothetical protein BJX96DRAFT_170311 [Aspergillus floccosus]